MRQDVTISLLRMVMMLKLGSLFDGSGGFPLAGILEGIKPVWSSEIEPFPIRVTTKRLPQKLERALILQSQSMRTTHKTADTESLME